MLLASSPVTAQEGGSAKAPKDLPTLDKAGSVEKFEATLSRHEKECLNQSGGGSGATTCFTAAEAWDREMNLAYRKLLAKLDKKQQSLLRASQRAWITSRDTAFSLNSSLLDRIYDEPGSMWAGPRAEDASRSEVMLVKARALMLRYWLALASRSPVSN